MLAEIDQELRAAVSQRTTRRRTATALEEIRGILNRRRYIRNLVRDVEKELVPRHARSHMSTFQIDFGQPKHERDRRHRPRHHQQPGRLHGPDRARESSPAPTASNSCPASCRCADQAKSIVGNAARELLITHPERTVYSVKRLMGRGVADVQDELKLFPFHIAEGSESVIQLAARASRR